MVNMRSIWKGSVAFGLVNVPVKVYAATEEKDVRFHQVHAEDGGRIRYKRTCELDGKVVEYADIAKAYESDDGRTVILTDEDFAQLPSSTSREGWPLGMMVVRRRANRMKQLTASASPAQAITPPAL
jgi:DNA end-binding protein Ku